MRPSAEPSRTTPSQRFPVPGVRAGISLVEFLLVASILAVGLLGLGAMQVAALRGLAGTRTRLAAATLADNALEEMAAGPGPSPAARGGPWVRRFDRNGQPAASASAFFTVTVTGSAPDAPDAPAQVRTYRATVTWVEDAGSAPGCVTLTRLRLP
jgi:Tfp pilus assembly protein PilV